MHTPHPWSDPSQLDDLFLYQLAKLLGSVGAMVIGLCEGGYGITRREWRMVGLLAEHGQLQPSALAELAQLDRTRTSRTVTALIAKGLVQREAQAGDARRALLQLSARGQQLFAELFPRIQAINLELLSTVPLQELHAMASAIARIHQQAQLMQQRDDLPKASRNRNASRKRTR